MFVHKFNFTISASAVSHRILLGIFLMSFGFQINANPFNEPDSLVLQIDDLFSQILTYHPVAKQADLLSENARQQIRLARGGFDPKLSSDYDTKQFKGKDYYALWKSELKVPVWIGGIDLKAGYEKNTGEYLNPQNDTDSGQGLAFAGISVPIGQGLFIDQRRAAMKQAEIFESLAEAEKVKMINKLLLEVAKDYWSWYFSYHKYRLFQNGYELALFRFNAVKIRVRQGDLARLDSVEAMITMQQREIDLQNASVELQNSRLILSNHIWGPEDVPLELSDTFVPTPNLPESFSEAPIEDLYEFARNNHPEIQKIRLKIEGLSIDEKLAKEMLKPTLNLNYNFLSRSGAPVESARFSEDYKFGVAFNMPVFLRKERAKVKQTGIKIEQTNLERIRLERKILNDLYVVYNDMLNLEKTLEMQEQMVNNYRKMLSGERQKFFNGESSVFYVNVREGKLIEAEVKLYDMQHKYAKSQATLRWAAGLGM
ncbi:TolC family protein [Flexithrix dorotheae]|uniref:TolC family protein n=1 Tax=Flexithrix dorotheae TaxID=70993 RepID=UPI0003768E3A|nr:TolC family protein [Flexithrix dorotheae]